MSRRDHPWAPLSTPTGKRAVAARRADSELKWNFFWAVDNDGAFLLLLQCASESLDAKRGLPKLKYVQVTSSTDRSSGMSTLIFKLLDRSQRDLFERLCRDIIASTADIETELEAVSTAINRTWRWQHFLRGGGGLLSPDEQKGLIGELLLLERVLIPHLGVLTAVEGWMGPQDAPKDFEIGLTCIESKTRRSGAAPSVVISSEYQLEDEGLEALFLYVADIAQAEDTAEDGFSLPELVSRIRRIVFSRGPEAYEKLENALMASGYRTEDDYDAWTWLEGETRIYEVRPGFPRIRASDLIAGVGFVRYSISLIDCEPFEITLEEMLYRLPGVRES